MLKQAATEQSPAEQPSDGPVAEEPAAEAAAGEEEVVETPDTGEAPAEEAAAEQPDATDEGESAEAPAEGADDVAPPTDGSPEAAEADAEMANRARSRPTVRPRTLRVSMKVRGERKIALAAVAGAHGVKGEVRLKLFTDSADSLSAPREALCRGRRTAPPCHSRRAARPQSRASKVFPTDRPRKRCAARWSRSTGPTCRRLERGEYYHADLIGLPACGSRRKRRSARWSAVENYGAGDLLEIEDSGRARGR